MEKLFITATRKGYRFQTEIGLITVEQLWDLPVHSTRGVNLATIAEQLNAQVRKSDGLDWLGGKVNDLEQEEIKNKLNIIKYIVETRRAEKMAAQEAESKAQLLAKLKEERNRRKEQSLVEKSDEDLDKLIKDLEQN